jgi:hypothetical protein
MQSHLFPWGWAVSQQASSGDEGVGATVGDGSAVVRGTSMPSTPKSAMANTAAPPHAVPIALALLLAIAPNSNFSGPNVKSFSAAVNGAENG